MFVIGTTVQLIIVPFVRHQSPLVSVLAWSSGTVGFGYVPLRSPPALPVGEPPPPPPPLLTVAPLCPVTGPITRQIALEMRQYPASLG